MGKQRRKRIPQGLFHTQIETLSHEGRGVAHINGKTTFIDNALPGESVEFHYTGRRSRFDEGIAENISSPSSDRVTPRCAYFGYCGGCSMQHISAAAQRSHKQHVLLEQFKHIGKLDIEHLLEPLTGPEWGYRQKARLAVKHVIKKGKTLVGFREKGSPFVADISRCEVLHPAVGDRLEVLQELLGSLSIHDRVPQIEVAVTEETTALVFRHLAPFTDADIEKLQGFQQHYDIRIYLQPGGYDSVHRLGETHNEVMSYKLPDYELTLEFLPTDFTQINSEINRKMIRLALEHLAAGPEDKVLDLFCGIGNFTLPIAKFAGHITGIEGDAGLIARAKSNADSNNLSNVDLAVANLADENMDYAFMRSTYNKLMIDPPRTGAKEIIEALNFRSIKRIVYVSCNPATLARDARLLVHEQGYRLVHVGIMDMFPHTAHVESIAVFEQT